MKRLFLALCLVLFCPGAGAAGPAGESLLCPLPEGWKVVRQSRGPDQAFTEMAPGTEGRDGPESLESRVLAGRNKVSPEQALTALAKARAASCPGGASRVIASGRENGYRFALWLLSCPRDAATGAPEYAWVKVIQGRDNLYEVRKIFGFEPSPEQAARWMEVLRAVRVCDPRQPGRACPAAPR